VTYYTSHDESRIDFVYLAYALSMLDLPSLARGVKPGINRNDVYALEVLLPTLDEQKRIVAVLDQAFAALDRARALAEANLKDAQSLFDSWLKSAFKADAQSWPVKPFSERGAQTDRG
jgi:type I restriction enzyme S subunit